MFFYSVEKKYIHYHGVLILSALDCLKPLLLVRISFQGKTKPLKKCWIVNFCRTSQFRWLINSIFQRLFWCYRHRKWSARHNQGYNLIQWFQTWKFLKEGNCLCSSDFGAYVESSRPVPNLIYNRLDKWNPFFSFHFLSREKTCNETMHLKP